MTERSYSRFNGTGSAWIASAGRSIDRYLEEFANFDGSRTTMGKWDVREKGRSEKGINLSPRHRRKKAQSAGLRISEQLVSFSVRVAPHSRSAYRRYSESPRSTKGTTDA